MSEDLVNLAQRWPERHATHYDGCEADHVEERDAARAEVERLTAERDMARAEVRRLIAERDQPESRPKGREVGRFGLDGHYLDAMEPTSPTDEDIWREGYKRQVDEYRKQWGPR